MGQKLNKSQRRAFARICYFAFFTMNNVGLGVKRNEWFMESLTPVEVEELAKLKELTNKLSNRWREFAWKLEGRV